MQFFFCLFEENQTRGQLNLWPLYAAAQSEISNIDSGRGSRMKKERKQSRRAKVPEKPGFNGAERQSSPDLRASVSA